jgi:uncharacterized protein (DUF362 family)/Pyruvate/2-oxoacid:ferredoxin oxidoreductase delta subunit
MKERVLVRKAFDLAATVTECLDFLGQDFEGLRVWVKPNLLAAARPEQGVTTDPELVRQVVRQLRARGATQVLVSDNPGMTLSGSVAAFLAPTGVVEASEGCFRSPADNPIPMTLKSRFVTDVRVPGFIKDVDLILSLPVFKTHGLTVMTGAVKNMFGLVVGAQKSQLHATCPGIDGFSELLVDIYQSVPVPMLHIMDALRGTDGQNGPAGGRVLALGRLLASRSGVALDSVMTLMTGKQPSYVPMLSLAGARGIGPTRREDIEIIGDFEVIRGFRVPSARLGRMAGAASGVYRLLVRNPGVEKKNCTRCRECEKKCPVEAIELNPYPVIDRARCIRCYCCVEVCPEKAMRIPLLRQAIWRNILGRQPIGDSR